MVKFVNDDVVEMLRRKAFEVRVASERLNRRAQYVDVGVAHLAHIEANTCTWADADEGLGRLVEDFLAMSGEQHSARASLLGIERRKQVLPRPVASTTRPRL